MLSNANIEDITASIIDKAISSRNSLVRIFGLTALAIAIGAIIIYSLVRVNTSDKR